MNDNHPPFATEQPHATQTQTIDIAGLMSQNVTDSDPPDINEVTSTSLGKLLQAVPTPALLVDRSCQIVFDNRISGNRGNGHETSRLPEFEDIFSRPAYARKVRSVITHAFDCRQQLVREVPLTLGEREIWGRIHFRPVRIAQDRFILLFIEDFSHERKPLNDETKPDQEILKSCPEPDTNVTRQLTELSEANEQLKREIEERQKIQEKLTLAAQIIESSNEAILITDVVGKIIDVNQAFSRITGYSKEEAIGKGPRLFASGRHNKAFYESIWQTLTQKGEWQGEVWDRRKDGRAYPKLLSLSAMRNDRGKVCHYVGIFSDITKIKQTEERLQRLAHYDPLTGLPNRALFDDRLRQALGQTQRQGGMAAIMLLDLDRFKNINDSLGHRFGDQLLVAVADRITGCIRESDTPARLGGDEFSVILTGIHDVHGAAKVARKLSETLSKPFHLDGREVFISTSMGITLYPHDGTKVGRLLQNADTALYHAKEQGKNNFQFFSRGMNVSVLRRMKLEQTLRSAMAHDHFLLHYQPMIDVASGRILGMEALLRWRHPTKGAMSAGKLIPIAEETGLIVPIGEWVLRAASKQNRAWQKMGFPKIRVAVNVSGRQLKQPDVVDSFLHILNEADLDPMSLEIELTESVMMEESEETSAKLEEFKKNGIQISIDDFGTGYSSLSYLKNFPVDKIKIDRSFVKDLAEKPYEQEIVKAVLAVAHSRKMKVVAEGVETKEEFKFLEKHGCDAVQGYFFCPPIPVHRFTTLLRRNKRAIGNL